VRLVDLLREGAHDFRAGGIGQPRQLGEMLVDLMPGRRTLARGTYQQRPLRGGRQCDLITRDDTPRLRSERLRSVEPARLVELSGKGAHE
jgi:hypothetical protein